MIFLSLLILIVAIALPSINKNISSILYIRICSIIFICSGALILKALYIQSIGSGTGIYTGLFHVTVIKWPFSYNIIFKIFFLIILILLTIYLLYQEYKLKDVINLRNNDNLIQSSNKLISDIFWKYIPGGITYHLYLEYLKNKRQNKQDEIEQAQKIADYQKEIAELKNVNEEQKIHYKGLLSKVFDQQNKVLQFKNEQELLSEKLSTINKFKERQKTGEVLSQIEKDLLLKESSIRDQFKDTTNSFSNEHENLKKLLESLKKGSFIPVDFNFTDFLKTLNGEELLALGSLLFNSIILSNTINIILIIFGDYLIKRFDLENKYPKLAKFIQLRRKLQNYYLKISFAGIFLALLPQFYVDIVILYSKLLEIFS